MTQDSPALDHIYCQHCGEHHHVHGSMAIKCSACGQDAVELSDLMGQLGYPITLVLTPCTCGGISTGKFCWRCGERLTQNADRLPKQGLAPDDQERFCVLEAQPDCDYGQIEGVIWATRMDVDMSKFRADPSVFVQILIPKGASKKYVLASLEDAVGLVTTMTDDQAPVSLRGWLK